MDTVTSFELDLKLFLLFVRATERKRFISAKRVCSTKRPMKSLSIAFAIAPGTSNSTASVTELFSLPFFANVTRPLFDKPLSLFQAIISPGMTFVFPEDRHSYQRN